MRQTYEKRNTAVSRRYNDVYSDSEFRERHIERRKKRQRQIARARAVTCFIIVCILVFIILFMTPLFNIRRINVTGNNIISLEDINIYVGDLAGRNLFKTELYDVEERLSQLAYIKEVDISKNYFKTALNINITERIPCAYLGLSGKYVLFDNECIVLEEATEKPQGIPLVIGISDSDDSNIQLLMGEERVDIMLDCIDVMQELGILERVNNINLSDLSAIKFKYEDRLDVLCGSSVDLEKKLRLFEASVNNNNLASNAKGTMDLSVTGNARYKP